MTPAPEGCGASQGTLRSRIGADVRDASGLAQGAWQSSGMGTFTVKVGLPGRVKLSALVDAELREEVALLERLEPRGPTRGRPSLAIPANWSQDPRIGPEDLREDVRILERLTAA